MSKSDHPDISMAVFAERVMHEQDGVASFIRIIDRVLVPLEDSKAALPIAVNYYLAIGLRGAGRVHGDHVVTLRTMTPQGKYTDSRLPVEVRFSDDALGTQFYIDTKLTVEHLGNYYFDLFWDDDAEPFIRVPLNIFPADS